MTNRDFDQIPIGMFAVDRSYVIRMWNLCMESWTGVDAGEAIGSPLGEVFPAIASEVYTSRLDPVFTGGPPVVLSAHLHRDLFRTPGNGGAAQRRLKSTVSAADLNETRVALFSVQDITAELERSRLLREQSEQRQRLLREHHHRTKNNLSMLASLLELQKSALYDTRDEAIMDVFISRVMSIQRVHEHLYKGGESFNLRLDTYLTDLVTDVLDANAVRARPEVDARIAEVEIRLTQAIPLGMIFAELITNSLKYAFGSGRGRISITGENREDDRFVLTYGDSGPGRPEGSTGTGSELNAAFAEQLGGTLRYEPGPGAVTILEFTLPAS